jgi:hypothetical protein
LDRTLGITVADLEVQVLEHFLGRENQNLGREDQTLDSEELLAPFLARADGDSGGGQCDAPNGQGYAIISEPEPWHRCCSKACDGEVQRLIGSIHQRLTKNFRYKTDRAQFGSPSLQHRIHFSSKTLRFFRGILGSAAGRFVVIEFGMRCPDVAVALLHDLEAKIELNGPL